jgi:hypothetical protein
MDPEFRELWRRRQDPFETHQLWDVDDSILENIRFQYLLGERIFFILTPTEIGTAAPPLVEAVRLLTNSRMDCLVVGRALSRPPMRALLDGGPLDIGGQAVALRGRAAHMSHEMWLLHSAGDDLLAWISGAYGQQIHNARLFHNFKTRIRKAVRDAIPAVAALPVQRLESLTTDD